MKHGCSPMQLKPLLPLRTWVFPRAILVFLFEDMIVPIKDANAMGFMHLIDHP
jgi:hypothetical protein